MFTKYAALVEGHTEKRFFEIALPDVHAFMPIKNGQSIDVLINSIVTGFKTLPRTRTVVFIWFDRERQSLTSAELAQKVWTAIEPIKGDRSVFIGVPDRELEAWILADEDMVTTECGSPFVFSHEGTEPKKECEKLIGSSAPGVKAGALKKAYASRIAAKSPSFSEFKNTYVGDWHWMNR